MEGDTKDLTVQGSKDREFELIGRQFHDKEKAFKRKKLSGIQCDSNINTAAEELVSSETIGS